MWTVGKDGQGHIRQSRYAIIGHGPLSVFLVRNGKGVRKFSQPFYFPSAFGQSDLTTEKVWVRHI